MADASGVTGLSPPRTRKPLRRKERRILAERNVAQRICPQALRVLIFQNALTQTTLFSIIKKTDIRFCPPALRDTSGISPAKPLSEKQIFPLNRASKARSALCIRRPKPGPTAALNRTRKPVRTASVRMHPSVIGPQKGDFLRAYKKYGKKPSPRRFSAAVAARKQNSCI